MVKYKLINNETHKIIYTNNEKEKEQLLEKGFYINGIPPQKANTTKTKKRKAVTTSEKGKSNQDTPESDI